MSEERVARQADRAHGLDYPKHLAGRGFSVVVHGDAAGVEQLGRYYGDHATSHDDLDCDLAAEEVGQLATIAYDRTR